MRFTTSEANLKKSGLITVYDVENRGLRKFNPLNPHRKDRDGAQRRRAFLLPLNYASHAL
jgi:hypothetical protein